MVPMISCFYSGNDVVDLKMILIFAYRCLVGELVKMLLTLQMMRPTSDPENKIELIRVHRPLLPEIFSLLQWRVVRIPLQVVCNPLVSGTWQHRPPMAMATHSVSSTMPSRISTLIHRSWEMSMLDLIKLLLFFPQGEVKLNLLFCRYYITFKRLLFFFFLRKNVKVY